MANMKHLNAAKRLQLYRALINAGRENLSDQGIQKLISLSRDAHIQKHYSPQALNDHTREMAFERSGE